MSLVEIKSDRGFFEWYGRKFADRGYRTGFTASQGATVSTDPTLYSGGLTAVVSDNIGNPSEGIFRSLKSARTYATSGQRMILGFAVNGGKIGDRIPLARPGSPAQVAETVLFLATNDFVTGEAIFVDGGERLTGAGQRPD